MIIIHDYNPDWILDFEKLRNRLFSTLGDLAISINHIGSTSVPGLGAKDIIDIQVTVHALDPKIARLMTAAGFTYREDITQDHVPAGENPESHYWQKMYFTLPKSNDQRQAHIHIRVDGNPNQCYALLFRDYLRAHPNTARTLEIVKRELAQRFPEDVDAYYAIKDPVYDFIWDVAKNWLHHKEEK
jgi:GrpB-like predicted nucleotidyltransferase (UPF0157 family)